MSSEEARKCPQEVLEIRQRRFREAVKLKSMLRRAQKKLQLASAGEERPQLDVTVADDAGGAHGGQDAPLMPYFLLQPKAKATNPPYLAPSEIIVLKDQDGVWRTARLNQHTPDYRNYSYYWGFYVLPADEAHLGDADENWAYLHPGEDWGVLRGVDTNLDLSRLDLQRPAGPQVPHILTTACETCNGGEVKVFEEELAYLQQQLPFTCAHGRLVTAIQPGVATEGPFLPTPRPGFPRLAASGPGPRPPCTSPPPPRSLARCPAPGSRLGARRCGSSWTRSWRRTPTSPASSAPATGGI